MIKVNIHGVTATLQDGEWKCSDSEMLNWLSDVRVIKKPGTYDPFPDHTLAKQAVFLLGGKITEIDEPGYDKDAIY